MIDPKLSEALDFSAEDLAFNRQLRFSPRQEAEEREGLRGIRRLIFIIIALWLLAVGLAWLTKIELAWEIAAILTIFAGLAFSGLFLTFPSKSNPLKVKSIHGPARLTIQRYRRSGPRHTLIVADKDFQIPVEAYNLIEAGQPVTVYFVSMPVRNTLLSMETG
jgi:hypothetical protein